MHKGPYKLLASRQLAAMLILMHALAVISVCLLSLSLELKVFILLGLVGSLYYHIKRYVLLSFAQSVYSISQLEKDDWLVWTQDGEQYAMKLQSFMFIGPHFIALYFTMPGKRIRYRVPLCVDSLDRDGHRRLRALLAHGRY